MTLKQKKILILFLIVILAILFLFLVIFPTFKRIKNISQKILETKSNLENIEKRTENLQSFRKKFPTIKDNLFLFENSFVDKEFPIDFINFLENTANSHQILFEISSLNSGKGFLSFQIKAIGEAPNIFRFLDKIENCSYLVQIEKLTLTKLSETELKAKEMEGFPANSLKLNFSFKVQTK